MKRTTERKRGIAGFTLVELMLVLVILGTLAAITVPRIAGRTTNAKVRAAKLEIDNLEQALGMFEVEMGYFPETDDGLEALLDNLEDSQDWNGPYLEKLAIPIDPWNNEFVYEYPGRYNPVGFDLYSMGPDQKEGTDDDIVNWMDEEG